MIESRRDEKISIRRCLCSFITIVATADKRSVIREKYRAAISGRNIAAGPSRARSGLLVYASMPAPMAVGFCGKSTRFYYGLPPTLCSGAWVGDPMPPPPPAKVPLGVVVRVIVHQPGFPLRGILAMGGTRFHTLLSPPLTVWSSSIVKLRIVFMISSLWIFSSSHSGRNISITL